MLKVTGHNNYQFCYP